MHTVFPRLSIIMHCLSYTINKVNQWLQIASILWISMAHYLRRLEVNSLWPSKAMWLSKGINRYTVQCHAVTWNNAQSLTMGASGRDFSKNSTSTKKFSFNVFQNNIGKWLTILLHLNMLITETNGLYFIPGLLGWLRYRELDWLEYYGSYKSLFSVTHWGRHKIVAIFQTIFSTVFSWMKVYEFLLRFHWSLFPINNIPVLVQIMAWYRSGDRPLSQPTMANLLKHICFTRS